MKLILNLTAIVFFLSNTLMAQEDISRSKKIENPQYFGWESFSQFNLNERRAYAEKDFSISTKKNIFSSDLKFGYTGKEINSTSQLNHFSVLRDYQLRELQQKIDPNSNYPNRGIYQNDMECQPYPLFEIKIVDNFLIGI